MPIGKEPLAASIMAFERLTLSLSHDGGSRCRTMATVAQQRLPQPHEGDQSRTTRKPSGQGCRNRSAAALGRSGGSQARDETEGLAWARESEV